VSTATIKGRKNTEESIQSAIVDYLRYSGWTVFQYAQIRAHGKLGGIIEAGHPDLLAIKNGFHLWIEVKRLGEELSPKQAMVHGTLRDAGALVVVWRSVEDAITALAPLGLGLEEWKP